MTMEEFDTEGKSQDELETRLEHELTVRGLTRAQLVKGGMAFAAALGVGTLFAACGSDDDAAAPPPPTEEPPSPPEEAPPPEPAPQAPAQVVPGEQRTVIWANQAVGDWNLPVLVGFREAADIVGWEFDMVGTPQEQFSPETSLNIVTRVTELQPDVLVNEMAFEAQADAYTAAQDAGTLVYTILASVEPQRTQLGLGFVGGNQVVNGSANGQGVAKAAHDGGRTDGVIVLGDHNPGNPVTVDRIDGYTEGINAYNEANGTSFTTEPFSDEGQTLEQSVGLYQAKIRQLGGDLAGIATTHGTPGAVEALKSADFGPGEIPTSYFDPAAATLDLVREGWIASILDQGLYPIGYVPVVLAWQWLERGFPPDKDYISFPNVITSANIDDAQARSQFIVDRGRELGFAAG